MATINKTKTRKNIFRTALLICCLMMTALCMAHDNNSVTIKQVKDGIYMLEGRGGNVGVSVGEDGVFMIDDQYAPMAKNVAAKIAEITTHSKVDFVLNTHWHYDHTGGNEHFGKSDSVIVAHENVRKRMHSGGFLNFFNSKVPPSEPGALPMITFPQSMKFHMNEQEIDVMMLGSGHAHTDGDVVVFFSPANVVHTGDIYFNGYYPYIDAQNGGSVTGILEVVNEILERIDDETLIIPGHGPLSHKKELIEYRNMLKNVIESISRMKANDMTDSEIVAAKPTKKYDKKWGNGIVPPDAWVAIIAPMLEQHDH